jgi:1,4-dihydroxy-2-naphthoate octaprenyltransferase
MSKEQILRKLTSRKFILTVALLLFSILCITGVIPVDMQEEWRGIVIVTAGVIAYIVGESATDVVGIIQQNEKEEE